MATFTLPDGTVIDPTSGQTVGQSAPAKLSSTEATKVAQTAEAPFTAAGLINQLKWGTNSALFALPDAVVAAFGKAAGLDNNEIPSFTKYFNRGEVAPQNMVERYARSISNAAAAGLPLTGALGTLAARTNLLSGPVTANAGTMKRVAKDMLDTIRKNPKATIAADLGFGAAYGGLEQSVEEFVDEGEYKGLAKAVVPFAGVMAVPAMLSMAGRLAQLSPTGQIIKQANQLTSDPQGQLLKDIETDPVLQQMLTERAVKFPGLNWTMGKVRNAFANQAAKKVNNVVSEMTDPELVDVQSNIRRYNELLDAMRSDPILSKMGLADRFLLDAAQTSLYGPILAARNQVVQNLSGPALKREQLRQQDLEKLFGEAFEALTPGYTALGPQMPFDQAIKVYITDYSDALNKTMKQIKGLTDEEALALSDRVKPVDMFDAGDSLRSMLVAQMDGVSAKLKKDFQKLTGGITDEGLPAAQREGMTTFEGIPSTPFANFAENLLSKYKLTADDRFYQMAGTPRPIRLTEYYLNKYEDALQKVEGGIIDDLVKNYANKELGEGYKSSAEEIAVINDRVRETYIKTVSNLAKGRISREKAAKLLAAGVPQPSKTKREVSFGDIFKATKELPSEELIADIQAAARKQAMQEVDFRITGAEAVDFLAAAQASRGQGLMAYNRMVESGIPETTARQLLDKNNALARDVEDFIQRSFGRYGNSPKLAAWVDNYKSAFSDGYQKIFPLLATKKTKTGEYLIPNEKVVQQALSSGENIRALRTIFGEDNQFFNQTLTDVMLDQAYRNKVIDPNTGLLDTGKYSSFLKTKANLVNQMPEAVQKNLQEELKIGEEVMRRVRDLEQRKADVEDVDFFRQLGGMAKVGRKGEVEFREGADPKRLIAQAINDPGTMRQLVDKFNKPEQLASLRRAVWRSVDEDLKNPENPAFLKNFLVRNGKSLNTLYGPEHMNNLKFLADVQERVFTGVNVIGKTSPFLAADEKLRQLTGASIGTFESTARAAAIRQISPQYAVVNLMARMVSRQQTNIYDAILYKALTDPAYAQELAKSTANVNTPAGVKQMAKLTYKAGHYFPAAIKIAGIEGVQALEQEREIPFTTGPAAPALPTAQGPLPPEPELIGTPEEPREVDFFPGINRPYVAQGLGGPAPRPQPTQRVATLPKMPAPPDAATYDRFARLFPQDFASSVIQSRQP